MSKALFNPLISHFFRQRKAVCLALVFCGVLSNCLTIILSLSIGVYYESLGEHASNKGQILRMFHISLPHNHNFFYGVFFLLVLAASLLQFLFRFGSQRIALNFSFQLRKKLFRYHLRAPLEDLSKKSIGSRLLRYSGDLKRVQSYLEKGLFQFGSDVFFIGIGIFVLFRLHLQASLYIIAGLAAGFCLMYLLSLKIKKLENRRTNRFSSDLSYIHDSFHGLETIKAWNREYRFISRFKDKTDSIRNISVRSAFWKSLYHVLPFAILFFLLLVVFFTHTRSPAEGSSFIPYILLLLLLFPAIKRAMRVSAVWKSGLAALRKIGSLLQLRLENEARPEAYDPSEGKVEFRNVSFSYDGQKEVLSNANFTFNAGKINHLDFKDATTIFKLLTGLYTPATGAILLDGTDLSRFSFKSIRQQVAFCSELMVLQGDTIFQSLFLEKQRRNFDDVHDCLQMLRLSIAKEDGKFDLYARIGQGGKLLSRTDRQKLNVARTILSKKRILLFDGIIEQLEPVVQNSVMAYLENLQHDRTIIVTAKPPVRAERPVPVRTEKPLNNQSL